MLYKAATSLFILTLITACGGESQDNGGGNTVAVPEDVVTEYAIDINANVLTLSFLLNQDVFPNGAYETASFSLLGEERDDLVPLSVLDGEAEIMLINGSYLVNYSHEQGENLPLNTRERVGEFIVDDVESASVDIVDIQISPLVNLAGNTFPDSGNARLYIQSRDGGQRILLGNIKNLAPSYRVIAGTYDIYYAYVDGEGIPKNKMSKVASDVDFTEDRRYVIELNPITLRTQFLLNEENFPESLYERADFFLVNPEVGDEVLLGSSYGGTSSVSVLPGTYDLHYRYVQGATIPLNTDKRIQTGLIIDEENFSIEANVSSILLSGKYLHNEGEFPSSVYESADIFAIDADTDAALFIGKTFQGNFSDVNIVPGNYHIMYDHQDGHTLPQNKRALIMSDLALTETAELNIHVNSVELRSNFSLSGSEFPSSIYSNSEIVIQRDGEEPEIVLTETRDQSTPIRVLLGEYDFIYRNIEPAAPIPVNKDFKFIAKHDVKFDEKITYDFKRAKIRVRPTLNNQEFPNSIYEKGSLSLGSGGQMTFIAETNNAETAEAMIVIAGEYHIFYQHVDGQSVPQNTLAELGVLVVEENF